MKLEDIASVCFKKYNPHRPTRDQHRAFLIFQNSLILLKGYKKTLSGEITELKKHIDRLEKADSKPDMPDFVAAIDMDQVDSLSTKMEELKSKRNVIQSNLLVPNNWSFFSGGNRATQAQRLQGDSDQRMRELAKP